MFISHSICGTLSQQPKQTKITVAAAFADRNRGEEKPKKHEGWGISGALGALWYLRRAVTLSSGPTGPPLPTYPSNKTSVNSTSVWGAEQSNRERGGVADRAHLLSANPYPPATVLSSSHTLHPRSQQMLWAAPLSRAFAHTAHLCASSSTQLPPLP